MDDKTLKTIKAAQGVEEKGGSLDKYFGEMKKIRTKGRVDTNKIKVVEIADHKNISLWTKIGKRIGPLHPYNAEKTFMLFWNIGIELSADEPTAEDIAAYKKTSEYAAAMKLHKEKRAVKEESRKDTKKLQDYLKQIAESSGQSVEAIHNILKSNQVKPVSQATDQQG